MKLLSQKEKERIAEKYHLYSQEGKGRKAICIAKFFIGNWTWYITEGCFEDDDFIMFGVVINGYDNEFGYTSLNELESLLIRNRFKVERDKHFSPTTLGLINDDELKSFLGRLSEEDYSFAGRFNY